ncbi:MAG: hypothetical protein FWC75_01270 [Oscillospiraceae bacterium]|nr:hypothetical protein [Oscillospiraceae bacterium]
MTDYGYYIMLICIIVAILIIGIVRRYIILKRFDKVTHNMDYHEVVSIVGKPHNRNHASGGHDIMTCTWKYKFSRYKHTIKIVVLKNNRVVSITDG